MPPTISRRRASSVSDHHPDQGRHTSCIQFVEKIIEQQYRLQSADLSHDRVLRHLQGQQERLLLSLRGASADRVSVHEQLQVIPLDSGRGIPHDLVFLKAGRKYPGRTVSTGEV